MRNTCVGDAADQLLSGEVHGMPLGMTVAEEPVNTVGCEAISAVMAAEARVAVVIIAADDMPPAEAALLVERARLA